MIRLDSDDLAVLFMSLIDGQISSPVTALPHKPQVGELGWKWGWYIDQGFLSNPWQDVVEYWN
jgi:hypothetical protein